MNSKKNVGNRAGRCHILADDSVSTRTFTSALVSHPSTAGNRADRFLSQRSCNERIFSMAQISSPSALITHPKTEILSLSPMRISLKYNPVTNRFGIHKEPALKHQFAMFFHPAMVKQGRITIYRKYMRILLNAPKDLRYQVMFEASALNGCRTGEVCTVQVEDFDFGDQVFWILDSKKHKYRSGPLNPIFGLHAEEYLRLNHLTTGPFFQRDKHSGRPGKSPFIQPQTVHKAWERQCVALGLPMMTPRIARAYSVWMLMYGYKEHATLGDVQDFLGHDDPHSTKIYLDMIDDFDSRKERYQRIVQSGEIEGTRVLKPNLEAKF